MTQQAQTILDREEFARSTEPSGANCWRTGGAAKVSPEPAMGLGWGRIPVGQGRSSGDRR